MRRSSLLSLLTIAVVFTVPLLSSAAWAGGSGGSGSVPPGITITSDAKGDRYEGQVVVQYPLLGDSAFCFPTTTFSAGPAIISTRLEHKEIVKVVGASANGPVPGGGFCLGASTVNGNGQADTNAAIQVAIEPLISTALAATATLKDASNFAFSIIQSFDGDATFTRFTYMDVVYVIPAVKKN